MSGKSKMQTAVDAQREAMRTIRVTVFTQTLGWYNFFTLPFFWQQAADNMRGWVGNAAERRQKTPALGKQNDKPVIYIEEMDCLRMAKYLTVMYGKNFAPILLHKQCFLLDTTLYHVCVVLIEYALTPKGPSALHLLLEKHGFDAFPRLAQLHKFPYSILHQQVEKKSNPRARRIQQQSFAPIHADKHINVYTLISIHIYIHIYIYIHIHIHIHINIHIYIYIHIYIFIYIYIYICI